jgi:hypothetical protein
MRKRAIRRGIARLFAYEMAREGRPNLWWWIKAWFKQIRKMEK